MGTTYRGGTTRRIRTESRPERPTAGYQASGWVMNVTEITPTEWSDLLPHSGIEAFHTIDALEVIDHYADGDLRLLAGFRGEQPIGLFPLFVREEWGLSFLLSPPPGLAVPRLGPIVMPTSPKRRKREKTNRRFTEEVLETVDADDRRSPLGIVAAPTYTDPRPYSWSGHRVDPRFVNVVDLEARETSEVIDSFSKGVRREIRNLDGLDLDVSVEGPRAAKRVCRDVRDRYAEQGLTYPAPPPFSADLVHALGNRSRVYVARNGDGEFLTGITILYSNERALFWQGGTKASYQNLSVNSLLHWRVIEDILEEPTLSSIERYDMGNAAVERIASYKSKFDAELVPHYEIKSNLMHLAKRAYSARRHLTLSQLSTRMPG